MNRKQFTASLRTALMQLDDLQSLERSPLLAMLPGGTTSGALMLQNTLIAGIESLKTMQTTSSEQMYEILYYRYVEQMTQRSLSYQLGISMRHLRRLQENAISLLADHLLPQFTAKEATGAKSDNNIQQPHDGMKEEIAWLRESFGTASSNLYKEMQEALKEGHILAKHYQVRIVHQSLMPVQQVATPSQIVRQSLLTVLSTAMTRLAAVQSPTDRTLQIEIAASPPLAVVKFYEPETPATRQRVAFDDSALNTASQLLAPFGGTIQLESLTPLCITLTVPAVGGIPVLLLDDNPDARRLIQRYAENSPFRIIATADSSNIIELAQQWTVRAILIDIMMPEVDGWDLLARLSHHPTTQHIPIAVCTILPQKDLAKLLGASLFLQKPISQQQLLDTLIALTSAESKELA